VHVNIALGVLPLMLWRMVALAGLPRDA